jgi:addiction module HigA family antidote
MRTTSVARTTTESIPRDRSCLGPAIHPGQILLEEFLKALGMTQAAAAKTLGVSTVRLNEFVRGKVLLAFDVPSFRTEHVTRRSKATKAAAHPTP